MIKRVCDMCQKNFPDARIKYKARRLNFCSEWEKIELCNSCLQSIISLNESIRGLNNNVK